MNAFGQAGSYLGMPSGSPNFSMGQNSLGAQQALQQGILGYQGQQAGIGRQFNQQAFNSQMNPGILGYLGAGVAGLGAATDIGSAFQRANMLKQWQGGGGYANPAVMAALAPH
jgi:hypothetical protein